MNNIVSHRRLVANSPTLFSFLLELGFDEIESEGHNDHNKVRVFILGDKIVKSSLKGNILLLEPPTDKDNTKELTKSGMMLDGNVIRFHGLTIHDELIKFFSTSENRRW